MGIKHFYSWYKKNFLSCILDEPIKEIDVLAIDMNGLFYSSLRDLRPYENSSICLFRTVCERMESIRKSINPKKMLILSVDGVAGMGKMNQQRQRRFRSQTIPSNHVFNSNIFTPGTRILDMMTKYIDWYIRTMMTCSPDWQKLVVLFSNEKVPGEGEHKIMKYFKDLVPHNCSVCIYGMDADLIMLGILLPHDTIMIARELERRNIEYMQIHCFKNELVRLMEWDSGNDHTFSSENAIIDFVFLCFLVGNDFLPSLPSLNIIHGAIDSILNIYKTVGFVYGHLLHEENKKIRFNTMALRYFLELFGTKEKQFLITQYSSSRHFFPDPVILKNLSKKEDGTIDIDMAELKNDYYRLKQRHSSQETAKKFLDGMFWVMNYYYHGIPDWHWFYPFHYAPFLSDLLDIIDTYTVPDFKLHEPLPILLQLLILLPPSDRYLLPVCMRKTVHDRLRFYFPETIQMDITGKQKENDGIVLLPPSMDLSLMMKVFREYDKNFTVSEQKRNKFGRVFRYVMHPRSKLYPFYSYYGNIMECPVEVTQLNIPS